jgi:anoctamin-10
MFVLVVPQIVAAYQKLAKGLVKWEDHPTPVGAEKSLTAKTL